ncbi:threonine/serine exporter family protein [Ligilactobacillus acidipiscis]|uniref:threonine/serine exporter family protein n=1 Tax=Ligilactobacillus acidipiscis TaxID=89059 RepID=UPI0022E2CF42|nr:threonine/serine exporter family protein [Ligilactobacillus acidipiscis]
MELVLGFIFSFLSTLGFGVITNVPRRVLIPAGITGAFGWTVYLLTEPLTTSIIVPNFLAALIIGLLGNINAVFIKAPVNLIYIPCLVSLVPGVVIYASLKDFTLGHYNAAGHNLIKTLTVALALDLGFAIAEVLFKKCRHIISKNRGKRKGDL